MVNYGNSKALVAVQDNQKPMTGNLSSGYAMSMDQANERPGNPKPKGEIGENLWGLEGTVLSGEPLAIEYNHAVLEDKPEFTDVEEEQHPTESKEQKPKQEVPE